MHLIKKIQRSRFKNMHITWEAKSIFFSLQENALNSSYFACVLSGFFFVLGHLAPDLMARKPR